jgi:PKD repeat protein
MKKTLLSVFAVLMSVFLFGQAKIAREEVLLEIGTATWCTYCPGAAMGAEDLIENGCDVAVIEYHTSDSYTNTAATTRASYCGIGGIPDAYFDGIENVSGGNHTQSMYPSYLPKYEQRIVVPSTVSIDWYGFHEGNTYTVISTIQKHASVSNDLTFHLALTESGIQEAWQGQTELHWVERWMHNEGSGEDITLSGPAPVTVTCTFDVPGDWVLEELELVAFVQDNIDKEVQQAIKVMLENLPPPPPVADFTADQTEFCDNGTVNFTDNSAYADEWLWEFPGGDPATSTQQNPTVTYETPGIYDVTLTVTNANTTDTKTESNYIQALTAPETPAEPSGNSDVCTTNMMDVYSVPAVPFATSYEWVLTPPEAGVVFGFGNSVNASWTGDVTGDVTLKVKATNSCGESEFSPELTITINVGPETFAVNGGGELCEGDEGVEVGLEGSQSGVIYELYADGAATGNTVTGDGNPISFGLINTGAVYTVKGQDPSGTCTATMSGNAPVTVHPLPEVFDVVGEGTYCEGTNGATITLQGSEDAIKYELYKDGVATEITQLGNGDDVIFEEITEEGIYTIMGDNEICMQEMNGEVEVIMMSMPAVPATPEGDDEVCVNWVATTDYTTAGGADAVEYDWSIAPADAGTIDGTGLTATVTWNNTYEGNADIAVRGVNDCGQSTFSGSFTVLAKICTGINENENQNLAVYPNPASDILNVALKGNGEMTVTITDALGKAVFANTLQVDGSYTEMINVDDLENGVYFIFVKGDNLNTMQKFLIK